MRGSKNGSVSRNSSRGSSSHTRAMRTRDGRQMKRGGAMRKIRNVSPSRESRIASKFRTSVTLRSTVSVSSSSSSSKTSGTVLHSNFNRESRPHLKETRASTTTPRRKFTRVSRTRGMCSCSSKKPHHKSNAPARDGSHNELLRRLSLRVQDRWLQDRRRQILLLL